MQYFPTHVAVASPYHSVKRSVRRAWRKWKLARPQGTTIRIKYQTTVIRSYAHLS